MAPEIVPVKGGKERAGNGSEDWSRLLDDPSSICQGLGPAGAAWRDGWMLEGIPELKSPLAE